jgi:lycopene cyclase domain-containing protein
MIPAYSAAVVVGFFLVILLDRVLRTRVIRPTPRMAYTTIVFILFQLVFDNFFTGRGLWVFNSSETMGIFVPIIPVENLFFGLEMVWFTIILYSFFSREQRK